MHLCCQLTCRSPTGGGWPRWPILHTCRHSSSGVSAGVADRDDDSPAVPTLPPRSSHTLTCTRVFSRDWTFDRRSLTTSRRRKTAERKVFVVRNYVVGGNGEQGSRRVRDWERFSLPPPLAAAAAAAGREDGPSTRLSNDAQTAHMQPNSPCLLSNNHTTPLSSPLPPS